MHIPLAGPCVLCRSGASCVTGPLRSHKRLIIGHSSRAGPLGAFELPVHGIEPYTSLPWHPLPWQSSKGYVFGTTETCDVHSRTPDGSTGQPELSGP